MAAGVGKNDHIGGPGSKFGGVDRPAAGRASGVDPRSMNPRYDTYNQVTRPATLGNIATAVGGMIPGVGMARTAYGAITGDMDPYSGPIGHTTGYSYDATNRIGSNGMPGTGAPVDPMRQQILDMLISRHPGLGQILQGQGLMTRPVQSAAATTPAPPPAPGSAQSPGLKFRPKMSAPRYLNADAPGLKPYGYTTTPYRYFA